MKRVLYFVLFVLIIFPIACNKKEAPKNKVEELKLIAPTDTLIVGEIVQLRAMGRIGNKIGQVTARCKFILFDDKRNARMLMSAGAIEGMYPGKVKVQAEMDGVRSNVIEFKVKLGDPPGESKHGEITE